MITIFFGKVRTFYKNDGILLKGDYNAPSNPVDYCEGADCVALFNRQVQLGDWIQAVRSFSLMML